VAKWRAASWRWHQPKYQRIKWRNIVAVMASKAVKLSSSWKIENDGYRMKMA
jgi:hypothetical protein